MPSSGLAEIRADLKRHRGMGDLTSDNLGSDLLDIAADSHRRCIDEERSPDDTPWDVLSTKYGGWKSTHFPGKQMGHLHEIMTSESEFEGDRIVEPRQASYTFGTSDQARSEAAWFEEGNEAGNRPPRPFTGLDEQAVKESDDKCDEHHMRLLAG